MKLCYFEPILIINFNFNFNGLLENLSMIKKCEINNEQINK